MPPVLKSKDDVQHLERLSIFKEKRKGERRVKTLTQGLKQKKFTELTNREKEDLLKAIAIKFGFIKAD